MCQKLFTGKWLLYVLTCMCDSTHAFMSTVHLLVDIRIRRSKNSTPNLWSWGFWAAVLVLDLLLDVYIVRLATTLITNDLCEVQSLSAHDRPVILNNVFFACTIGKWMAYVLAYISSMIGINLEEGSDGRGGGRGDERGDGERREEGENILSFATTSFSGFVFCFQLVQAVTGYAAGRTKSIENVRNSYEKLNMSSATASTKIFFGERYVMSWS